MIAVWSLLVACGTEPAVVPAAPPADPGPVAPVSLVSDEELRTRLFSPSPHGRIVNFWATWCAPCRAEMPHLKSFAEGHPDIEMVMVSLDLGKLRDRLVIPFVRTHGLDGFTHFQLEDPDPVKVLAGVVPDWPDVVPVTLVVDRDGQVVRQFARAITAEDLETALP